MKILKKKVERAIDTFEGELDLVDQVEEGGLIPAWWLTPVSQTMTVEKVTGPDNFSAVLESSAGDNGSRKTERYRVTE